VITRQGNGRVLAQEILARKILVAFEDNRRMLVDAADVLTVVSGQGGGPSKKQGLPAKDADSAS
jgi:hypothetical protein